MNREIPILFKNKSKCCACGACLNACPKQAISMQEDEFGFRYPVINEADCIRCGKCKKVCAYQSIDEENCPIEAFAGVAKDENIVKKSSSGGIFATLAKEFIKNGGVVAGASLQSDFSVKHTIIDSTDDIAKLQGSKYVQSDTAKIFQDVKKHLDAGRQVLFSGTPCQVAGLYGYLGKRDENLTTVDIVCHGVPNARMLQEYLHILSDENKGDITEFTFRDKSIGWGKNGSATINNKKIKLWQSSSSYIYYFSMGWICRENCYKCKYACKHRPGDITLGDYWGIEKQHPDYLGKNKWDESKGISMIVANSEMGRSFLKKYGKEIDLKPSTFEKVSSGNERLQKPNEPGQRAEILEVYKNGGWKALDERFRKKIGWRYYKSQIKNLIPTGVKRWLKSRI